jgi:hypothetical protein
VNHVFSVADGEQLQKSCGKAVSAYPAALSSWHEMNDYELDELSGTFSNELMTGPRLITGDSIKDNCKSGITAVNVVT